MASAFQTDLDTLGPRNEAKGTDENLKARLEKIDTWSVDELLTELDFYDLPQIERVCGDDPWLLNYLTNLWEYNHGVTTLTSYPWNVCLPLVDVCNAACTFCNSWLRGRRWMGLDELENFAPIVRNAKLLGLAGHGEPLIHPEFEALSRRFSELIDRRCGVYLITNGYLLSRYEAELEAMNLATYNISLNAATAETHETVMGLGSDAFERVIGAVKGLIEKRNSGKKIVINISLVVVKQNLHEVASFVELGNELGVNNIYVRTLRATESATIAGLNYHLLGAADHLEFERIAKEAKQATQRSSVPVESDPDSWVLPIFKPEHSEFLKKNPPKELSRKEARDDPEVRKFYDEKFKRYSAGVWRGRQLAETPTEVELYGTHDPFDRRARFMCSFPYYNLNLNDFEFKMVPCCYMEAVPGYELNFFDGQFDFFEAWNCAAFVELRRSLASGPLLSPCKVCPVQGRVDRLWQAQNLGAQQPLIPSPDESKRLVLRSIDQSQDDSQDTNLLNYWSTTDNLNGQCESKESDGLHVMSSSDPYAWSVDTVPFQVAETGSYRFTVKFRLKYGVISFGVIDVARTKWLAQTKEDFVSGNSFVRTVVVDLIAGESVQLLLANNNIAARRSSFVIEETHAYISAMEDETALARQVVRNAG